jgi:long-chain acyl-CoA synthetase
MGVTSTRSRTMADLLGRAVEDYGDLVAVRHKVAGEWRDVTFAEVGEIVRELALGLIDLGIEPGEPAAILCTTRPEWTYVDLALTTAGVVVVPIYPTSSAAECEWVLRDSGCVLAICENAEQAAKIEEVRAVLPALRRVLLIDAFDNVRACGRGLDPAPLAARAEAVRPEDPLTIMYTSGTTGPPKGCVLSHGNYRSVIDMLLTTDRLRAGETVYLFLPLAHAFAKLTQLGAFDIGATLAYFGGDVRNVMTEVQEVRPEILPAVPRIFEKLYALAVDAQPPAVQERLRSAARLGVRVRDGEELPPEELAQFERDDEELLSRVRALFGGRVRHAYSGAAPIAPEILEFFYGAGVPVLEGYGMTETATAATYSSIEHHRFGSVGRALPGMEARIADDGELLLKGPNVFQGYHGNAEESFGAVVDGWLHTGDLARIDGDGYVYITGRKKDVLITAGGKKLTPANLENALRQSPFVSYAVMHADRRPYAVVLVTLDEEAIVAWAAAQGIEERSLAALAKHPAVGELMQAELDKANAKVGATERAKAFFVLERDLSQEAGELTPTLKVKRNVIAERFANRFDALYQA